MNNKYLIAALTLILLGINHKALATPVSALINLSAEVTLTESDAITVTDHSIDSKVDAWGTLLDPLNASVSATASDTSQTLTVSGSASATWGVDGNSGNVSFRDVGFSGDAHQFSLDLRGSSPIWSYTLIADKDGVFSMAYDVSVIDAIGVFGPFGLSGWDIDWSGTGGGLSLMDALDPTANGTFSRHIAAGQFYTIALNGGPGLGFGSSENHLFSTHVEGNFNFTISPVPEPSAFLLLLLGLIALKIFHRKRT